MTTPTNPGVRWLARLVVLAACLPGACALMEEAPLIAACAVAAFMLLILIIVIVYSVSAAGWIKSSKISFGKVKMPKSYFRKKKEANRRILAGSTRSRSTQDTYVRTLPMVAKTTPPPATPLPAMPPPVDKDTLVHGWNQEAKRAYEEKGYTMELEDENEEEFQIETTLVDNEVLDVGPYKSMHPNTAQTVEGNVYKKPYLYTHDDKVTVSKSTDANGGMVSAISSGQPIPMPSDGSDFSIEAQLIRL